MATIARSLCNDCLCRSNKKYMNASEEPAVIPSTITTTNLSFFDFFNEKYVAGHHIKLLIKIKEYSVVNLVSRDPNPNIM